MAQSNSPCQLSQDSSRLPGVTIGRYVAFVTSVEPSPTALRLAAVIAATGRLRFGAVYCGPGVGLLPWKQSAAGLGWLSQWSSNSSEAYRRACDSDSGPVNSHRSSIPAVWRVYCAASPGCRWVWYDPSASGGGSGPWHQHPRGFWNQHLNACRTSATPSARSSEPSSPRPLAPPEETTALASRAQLTAREEGDGRRG